MFTLLLNREYSNSHQKRRRGSMIQKRLLYFTVPVLVLGIALSLTGCEQNVFKSLVKDTGPTDTKSLIESGHFTEAISKADETLNDSSATPVEKQQAYVDKGTAILGQNNVEFSNVLSVISEFTQDTVNTKNAYESAQEKIPIDVDAAKSSAEALNSADELTSDSLRLTSLINIPTVNNNVQFTRGVANLVVVIKMCSLVMTVESDNTVTLNREISPDWTTAVNYLTGSPTRTIYYYAANAQDAFVKSNALTSSQLNIVTKVATTALNIKMLRTAMDNNTTFTIVDRSGVSAGFYTTPSPFTSNSVDREALLHTCMNKIGSYVK